MAVSPIENFGTFNVCVIGPSGVGKTTMVNRALGIPFDGKYKATLGVEIHRLTYKFNSLGKTGQITFTLLDCGGVRGFSGIRGGYIINADAAIIVFSLEDKEGLKKAEKYHDDFLNVCPGKPVVVVGSIFPQHSCSTEPEDVPEWAKDYTIHGPQVQINFVWGIFVEIARKLLNNKNLMMFLDPGQEERNLFDVQHASNITKEALLVEGNLEKYHHDALIFLCGKFGILFEAGKMLEALKEWITDENRKKEDVKKLVALFGIDFEEKLSNFSYYQTTDLISKLKIDYLGHFSKHR